MVIISLAEKKIKGIIKAKYVAVTQSCSSALSCDFT